ncbi:hypothetical protein, partial [Sphingomonas baiyangensis]|uniref:hypothetical protein n=1 Tax=Sphingomonas baiyangensis TaxID=2572576 RepID=UPI003742F43C
MLDAMRRRLLTAGMFGAATLLAGCGEPAETGATAPANLQAFLPALDPPVDTAALPPLPDALPLAPVAQTPYRVAPPAAALAPAAPARWGGAGDDGYAWIDRADTLFDVIGDSPPDYGFAYDDGIEPWGWDAAGGHSIYAEPIDDGYRYYYYEPGGAAPFMVRDPWRSYGFADDRLVAVYDNGGGILPYAAAGAFLPLAGQYLARGRDLRRVSYRGARRRVAAPLWAERQPYVRRARQQWAAARDRVSAWSDYRARQSLNDRPRIRYERRARRAAAQRFADWRRNDFAGEAPRFYRARADRPVSRADSRRMVRADRQREAQRERRYANRAAARADRRVSARAQQREARVAEHRTQARSAQRQAARLQQRQARVAERRTQARSAQRQAARSQQRQARVAERRTQARSAQRQVARSQQRQARVAERWTQARSAQRQAARSQQRQARVAERRTQARPAQRQAARSQQRQARVAERRTQSRSAQRQAARSQQRQARVAERRTQSRSAQRQAARSQQRQGRVAERRTQARPA